MRILKIYFLVTIVCLAYGQTDSLFWINKYDRKLTNKSDTELLQLQNEYMSSEILKDPYLKQKLFRAKIDINKFQEFKKLGIDLNKLFFTENGQYWKALSKESILYEWYPYIYFTSNIIAIGTVIDSLPTNHDQFILNSDRVFSQLKQIDFPFNPISFFNLVSETTQELFSDNRVFPIMFKLKITEFIKGKQYYNDENPLITHFTYFAEFEKGQKVIMFLPLKDDPSGIFQYYYSCFRKSEEFYNSLNYCIYMDSYFAKEKNGKIINDINSLDLHTDSINNIEKVAKYMKKLEKINDTPNFYNRSYK